MKKGLWILLVALSAISLAGCVTVKKVVRERVDQDISGNKGYLSGSAPAVTAEGPKDREYIDVRVELPTWDEIKKGIPKEKGSTEAKERTIDKSTAGNRGYLSTGAGYEEELPVVYRPAPAARAPEPQEYEYLEEEIEIEETFVPLAQKTYKVKEGDSLSKISKEVYGKASKWTLIYEANSDKIKDPSRLKVGTVLVIPEPKKEKGSSRDIK